MSHMSRRLSAVDAAAASQGAPGGGTAVRDPASSATSAAARPSSTPALRTLAHKVWDSHVVRRADGEPDLVYVDLHLVHEVTSPQAFDGLRAAGRKVRRPDLTLATEDHNVPTTPGPIVEPL